MNRRCLGRLLLDLIGLPADRSRSLRPITIVQWYGTFGSLTFRVFDVKLSTDGSPLWLGESCMGVGI